MKFIVLILALLSLASADNWAVLVAGSDGYWNYRHQADIAHAYHILIQNGYKPENVIVFAKNDVPTCQSNPIPNSLYNRPGDDSINYYENYVIDYEGDKVNPETYLKVLTGDESAGGKVLKSTEEDNVLLVFSDHGGPDVICFPDDDLYSDKLMETFQTMREKKMFKKIVYYMEACYSGSMWGKATPDGGIYALTAANDNESSWAYYCDSPVVHGVEFSTGLGDEFSIHWMENVDEGNLKQTFDEHATVIRNMVKESHVSQYGDKTFLNEPISEVFEGPLAHIKSNTIHTPVKGDRGDIYLNKLNYLKREMMKKNDLSTKNAYEEELELISRIDSYFNELVHKMEISKKISYIDHYENMNFECYRSTINRAHELFGRSDYLNKYYMTLAAMCEQYPNVVSQM